MSKTEGMLLVPTSSRESDCAPSRFRWLCKSAWSKTKAIVLDAFETLNGGKAHRLLLSSLEDLEAINTALVDRVHGFEERVSKLERSQCSLRIFAVASAVAALVSVVVVLNR